MGEHFESLERLLKYFLGDINFIFCRDKESRQRKRKKKFCLKEKIMQELQDY